MDDEMTNDEREEGRITEEDYDTVEMVPYQLPDMDHLPPGMQIPLVKEKIQACMRQLLDAGAIPWVVANSLREESSEFSRACREIILKKEDY